MMLIIKNATASPPLGQRARHALGAGSAEESRLAERVLSLLGQGAISMPDLEAQLGGEQPAELALLWLALAWLARVGLVDVEIVAERCPLALLQGALPDQIAAIRQKVLRLSRFAGLRPQQGKLLVETPFSAARVLLLGDSAGLVCMRLASGVTLAELSALPALAGDRAAGAELVMALGAIGALDDRPSGDALAQWEHHDAMFHARTRAGRAAGRQGGTCRFLGQRPPEPALPRRACSGAIALPELPLGADAAALQGLLGRRLSRRAYGPQPPSAAELGTLLRLVARNTTFEPADPDKAHHYETLRRPYPSGGGCHELHIYPVVHRCAGLARGVYCYDGAVDRLLPVAAMSAAGERLLRSAARSMGSRSAPDILLCIAARFGRVNWKYEAIAYSLILKNVGVLLQTLYLAATALRLAPCALGCGDTQDFLAATGCQPFTEESVGEFALGSCAQDA